VSSAVVLVLPDRTLRQSLHDWLSLALHQCTIVAVRSDEAVAVAQSKSPSVILIDIDPAEANPLQLIRRVKEAAPRAKIIALTFDDHEALRQEVTAAGATACVRKSTLSDEFLAMIRAASKAHQNPGPQLSSPPRPSTKPATGPKNRRTTIA